jgi:transposase
LALALEDLDSDIARADTARTDAGHETPVARAPGITGDNASKGLPEHLPRVQVTLDLKYRACPDCGDALHPAGESVSEMLDWVPAELRVVQIRRPKYGCRGCGTIHQSPAPERPIARGLATPALIAQVLVSKYCDHTPLYRQARIFARHGVDLNRSTPGQLGGWRLLVVRAII